MKRILKWKVKPISILKIQAKIFYSIQATKDLNEIFSSNESFGSNKMKLLKDSYENSRPKEIKDEILYQLVSIYLEDSNFDMIKEILNQYSFQDVQILNQTLKLLLQKEFPFSDTEFPVQKGNEETKTLKMIHLTKNNLFHTNFEQYFIKYVDITIQLLINKDIGICNALYHQREGQLERFTYISLISKFLEMKEYDLAFEVYEEMKKYHYHSKDLFRAIRRGFFAKNNYKKLIDIYRNQLEFLESDDYLFYMISLLNSKESIDNLFEIMMKGDILTQDFILELLSHPLSDDNVSAILKKIEKLSFSEPVYFLIIEKNYKLINGFYRNMSQFIIDYLIKKLVSLKDYDFLVNFENHELIKNEEKLNLIIGLILETDVHYDYPIQQIFHKLSELGLKFSHETMNLLFDHYIKEKKIYSIYFKLINMGYTPDKERNDMFESFQKPRIDNLELEDQLLFLQDQLQKEKNILMPFSHIIELNVDIKDLLKIFHRIPKEKSNYLLSVLYQKMIKICLLKHQKNEAFLLYTEMRELDYETNIHLITQMIHEFVIHQDHEKILKLYHDLENLKITLTPELEKIIHFSEKSMINKMISMFKE